MGCDPLYIVFRVRFSKSELEYNRPPEGWELTDHVLSDSGDEVEQ